MLDYHCGDVPNIGQPPNTPDHNPYELVTVMQKLWKSPRAEPKSSCMCSQVIVMPPVGEWVVTSVECP